MCSVRGSFETGLSMMGAPMFQCLLSAAEAVADRWAAAGAVAFVCGCSVGNFLLRRLVARIDLCSASETRPVLPARCRACSSFRPLVTWSVEAAAARDRRRAAIGHIRGVLDVRPSEKLVRGVVVLAVLRRHWPSCIASWQIGHGDLAAQDAHNGEHRQMEIQNDGSGKERSGQNRSVSAAVHRTPRRLNRRVFPQALAGRLGCPGRDLYRIANSCFNRQRLILAKPPSWGYELYAPGISTVYDGLRGPRSRDQPGCYDENLRNFSHGRAKPATQSLPKDAARPKSRRGRAIPWPPASATPPIIGPPDTITFSWRNSKPEWPCAAPKSSRSARDKANLRDAYGLIKDGEAFLLNVHIGPYSHGNIANHDETRTRKLLLHREEVRKLLPKTQIKGHTLIPTRLYFRNGRVKVRIGRRQRQTGLG